MSDWLPSLNALRAFEAVARHLSYQAAARELRVTPAAVKQLVSKLESSMGSPLLHWDGRQLSLTPRGMVGLDDLSDAIRSMTTSVQKMRGLQKEKQLIITVEPSFAVIWLVPRLAAFRRAFPTVSVLIESSPEIVDLARSEADVAIRYGVESEGHLVAERLLDDQIFPACSPSLAKGPPALRRLRDLNAVTLLHWDVSQLAWAHSSRRWFVWKSWLAHVGADGVSVEGGLHFNEYGMAVQAAIAGQGVILASGPVLREPLEANLLVCPFDEKADPGIGYDVISTEQARRRPEVIAFIEWILEAARGS